MGKRIYIKLELRGDERVLDIGCSEGKVTAEIAKHVPNSSVMGIDNSEDQIRFAQINFPPKKYPNLSYNIDGCKKYDFQF
ncbi:MAG: trans-aconitate 2-methyltransferase [Candidatus Lokiarchaeia archaeon]